MKFKYILPFVSAAFMYTACTDLEVENNDSIVAESADGTFSGDPTALLSSVYDDLGLFPNQDNIYSLYSHTSDEMIGPTRATDWGDNGVWRQLHAHTWSFTHSYILNAWNDVNSRAFKCNQVLASNPTAMQEAEAKFMRAFYRFWIMDAFGQMPDRGVNEGVEVDPKVYSRSEAFNLIEADLLEAIPNLPSLSASNDNKTASKGAAYAMLTRLYLNKAVYTAADPKGPYTHSAEDLNKVVEYADLLAAEGYALEDNYFESFTATSTNEPILVSPQGSPENRWRMTLHYDQNPGGWNGFSTLSDFYSIFEDGDDRKGIASTPDGSEFSGLSRGFLVGEQMNDDGDVITNSRNSLPLNFEENVPLLGADTDDGVRAIKYHPADAGNYIILRYGEAYLNKAEAIMRGATNGDKTAMELVNELRAKRGASALSSLDEASMLDERGRELYWEGLRRIDQIRFGTWNSTWSDKTVTDDFRVLFPIPSLALSSNPNLQQNDGYNQ